MIGKTNRSFTWFTTLSLLALFHLYANSNTWSVTISLKELQEYVTKAKQAHLT